VEARYYAPITTAEQFVKAARAQLASAEAREPWLSRVATFFGFRTEYGTQVLFPLMAELHRQELSLSDLRKSYRTEIQQASKRGSEEYQSAHALRRQETAARAERTAQRKQERRIQYLERSPAIRSAARFFRRLLIQLHITEDKYVACFYCGVSIPAAESHLEHKRPVSRGGDNRRTNLVLACPSCNLKKGKKTHEEFLRSRESDAH
jgi:5-methylcytosine-specific restriction endonuclease McrA